MEAESLANIEARKSWTAYVRPVVIFLMLSAFSAFLALLTWYWVGFLCFIVVAVRFVTLIMYIHSSVLFVNEDGVWVFSGIFPWSRGVSGIKWRDIEKAVYITGFWSWLCKSYTVNIKQRFEKYGGGIYQSHLAKGDEIVSFINDHHQKLLGEGSITYTD